MNDWLKNFQSSYGALANNSSPRPTGPKSSWMTGAAGKVASKSKMANLPANYKSTEAAAFKAADAAKGGMKIGDWSADQWLAVGKALTPLMERLQKRRRR